MLVIALPGNKIGALTCLNSKSTSEDKADNYDDLKNIPDDQRIMEDDRCNQEG
jgi:hypothetical protein